VIATRSNTIRVRGMSFGARRHRRGVAAVEFALCAPVFFLFIFAMFEFTWMNVLRHTADNAAYEASRIVMVPGATAAQATAEANRILRIVGARGTSVTVTPGVIRADTRLVTVDVSVPMDRNGLIAPRFSRGQTLDSRSTLRTERVDTR
jgi:Flp pilus assembly protein TadG